MISLKFLCNKLVLFLCATFIKAWEHLQVIPFDEWNTGATLNKINMTSIPVHVLLSQIIIEQRFSQNQCENILNSKSFLVIIANFYVSEDGQICVGHGWDSMGVPNLCSSGDNKPIIEISFIKDSEHFKYSTKQLKAAQKLLEQGVLTRKLSETYDLFDEWQFIQEYFPLKKDYKNVFETWPHWTSNLSQCTFLNDYNDTEYEDETY